MAENDFQEIVTTSWGSRIKNAIAGTIFGLIMFIGSFFLLTWNEGNSVRVYQTLQEGQKIVQSISPNTIDPNNEGKLVHVTGLATTTDILTDKTFNVTEPALKLKRSVSMYQWEETKSSQSKSNPGGSKTTTTNYHYEPAWTSTHIDSSRFKHPEGHENPKQWTFSSENWSASVITLGAFHLSNSQISDLGNYQPLNVKMDQLPDDLKSKLKATENGYYMGDDPQVPKIGDLEITFSVVKPSDITIIAKQIGNTFEPYYAKAGSKIDMLSVGTFSAEYMFQKAFEQNELITWGLRIGGLVLMWLGLYAMLQPIVIIADYFPILGFVSSFGFGLITGTIAISLSIFTIALAWIGYHPIAGTILLITGILVFIAGFFLKRLRKTPLPVPTPNVATAEVKTETVVRKSP